ncbi:inorganic pyrophosphatase [Pelotomaculum terephthalicicum JT]|uniref:inorganic pyrophosphatase n=1 Tax=Pelotomaculum TaxID=191373 RepID=UPI0009D60F73|nr:MULTISPECIES: inorganic pyrophosphatase [Pelotomaculum]MCG9968955.1 inorganic pyrophosphatase [Pelotomaculum terephthalicicum JT]OPX86870.1 MAG: Inorganic pyrophosphatase [Pelotomaculum sp. PtaB.Bin117]OPY60130.1 MAG: Inorganic pyrophosphatase [Pelotomaculum sp. PtaU1.Bin065]
MNKYVAHPWHGIPLDEEHPYIVNAYIEVTPSDTLKYELDKTTGLLKIDRPQLFSNICPTLYGLIPQTYCGERVAKHCRTKFVRKDIIGDKDPLDICVLTEKIVTHGNILLKAIPIGGIKLIDNNEADDKIVAVLKDDALYGEWENINQCPSRVLERLEHYFLTYKKAPKSQNNKCEIVDVYGKDEALNIIKLANEDYKEQFIK